MMHIRLPGALVLAALLTPVCAMAQTVPVNGPPPYTTTNPAQVGPYSGQRGGRGGRGAYMRAVNSLALSSGQRQQIEQYVGAMKQADQNADRRTKRGNRKRLHQEIDSVLTPQQVEQVRSEVQAQRAQRQQQRPAAPITQPAPVNQPGVVN